MKKFKMSINNYKWKIIIYNNKSNLIFIRIISSINFKNFKNLRIIIIKINLIMKISNNLKIFKITRINNKIIKIIIINKLKCTKLIRIMYSINN